ncbi:MAG: type II secretion system protein GspG [Candidatus Aureabacteria bacterium]|nr:type II secretion system protein GspG [Candidatus Auribacterota bacterium]
MRPFSGKKGFSITELLMVVGIIIIIAGLLLPVLLRSRHRANETSIPVDLNQLRAALEMYYSDWGTYPYGTNASMVLSLNNGYFAFSSEAVQDGLIIDANGIPYVYKYPGDNQEGRYDLYSASTDLPGVDITAPTTAGITGGVDITAPQAGHGSGGSSGRGGATGDEDDEKGSGGSEAPAEERGWLDDADTLIRNALLDVIMPHEWGDTYFNLLKNNNIVPVFGDALGSVAYYDSISDQIVIDEEYEDADKYIIATLIIHEATHAGQDVGHLANPTNYAGPTLQQKNDSKVDITTYIVTNGTEIGYNAAQIANCAATAQTEFLAWWNTAHFWMDGARYNSSSGTTGYDVCDQSAELIWGAGLPYGNEDIASVDDINYGDYIGKGETESLPADYEDIIDYLGMTSYPDLLEVDGSYYYCYPELKNMVDWNVDTSAITYN